MGRPKKTLTDEQIVELEALAAYLTQEQIADYFGMAERTLRKRMDEDESVRAAYKTGRAKAIRDVAKGVLQRAREGDNACAFFYLKTQAGWRETKNLEHSGKIETPGLTVVLNEEGDEGDGEA